MRPLRVCSPAWTRDAWEVAPNWLVARHEGTHFAPWLCGLLREGSGFRGVGAALGCRGGVRCAHSRSAVPALRARQLLRTSPMLTLYLLLLLFLLTVPLLMRGRVHALASGEVKGLLGPGTTVEGLDLRLLKAQPERLQPLRGFVTQVGVRPVQVRDPNARVPGGYLPPPGREPTYLVHCVFVRDREGRIVELHSDLDGARAHGEAEWLAGALGVPVYREPAVPPGPMPPPGAGGPPGSPAWGPPATGAAMAYPAGPSAPYGAQPWQPAPVEENASWVNDWTEPAHDPPSAGQGDENAHVPRDGGEAEPGSAREDQTSTNVGESEGDAPPTPLRQP